jgi:pilus assembly protein CpaB
MNRNRMLVVAVIALILSGGVSYLAYRVLQSRLQPAEVTVKIVAAAKKLELGARITKEDTQLVDWPKSTPLAGSFSDPEQVVGRGLMTSVQVNEPILESKLAPKEAGVGLTTIIPEGMRALTIQVNSIIGVSGFVLPGSRVDLILIGVPPQEIQGAKIGEQASKIILENLEVIAAGQNVQRDVEGKPQTVQDVTLLLSPEQAEKVALATTDGRIQLALRNPMDKNAAEPPLVLRTALYLGPTMDSKPGETKGKAVTPEKSVVSKKAALSGKRNGPAKSSGATARVAARKAPVVAPLPAPPPPRVVVVEVIQGARRAKESFEEKTPEEQNP